MLFRTLLVLKGGPRRARLDLAVSSDMGKTSGKTTANKAVVMWPAQVAVGLPQSQGKTRHKERKSERESERGREEERERETTACKLQCK